MKSDSFTTLLTRLLDSYGGEYSLLGDLFKIIGREDTLKMMEIFKGETITFPSKELVDDKLKVLEGYVMYKIEGRSWEETVHALYGENPSSYSRKYLRNCIRDVSRKVEKSKVDLTTLTTEDIDKFRDDRTYIKEVVNEDNSN